MNGENLGQRKPAVLIDGDNAPPSIAEGLVPEIAKYGIASIKRGSSLGCWSCED